MRKLWPLLIVLSLVMIVCEKPAELGIISVRSEPQGADVFLNDSLTGLQTNCLLEDVPFDTHTIRLSMEGYTDWQTTVVLTEEADSAGIYAGLSQSPGILEVNSTPTGADIWLNGVSTGQVTSHLFSNLPTGQHAITLTLSGYLDWDTTVTLVGGDTATINATLQAEGATGAIQVNSTPTGAWIWLDGDSTGFQTDYLLTDLAPGSYTVLLRLEGYEDYTETVTVTADDTAQVDAALVPTGPGQVTGLSAEGTTDGLGIRLTWIPVVNAEGYNVYFDGTLIGEDIVVTAYTDANPSSTGSYTVTAVIGTDEGPESDPVSTAPSAVQNVVLYELNGTEEAGLGWNSSTGNAVTYSMADETNRDVIDCYFSNWAAGTAGQYALTSASEVGSDPGNTWMPGAGWRITGISDPLASGLDDVTVVPESPYYNFSDASVGATFAVKTTDNHYALVEVTSIITGTGRINIRTTFQTVENFRLFQ